MSIAPHSCYKGGLCRISVGSRGCHYLWCLRSFYGVPPQRFNCFFTYVSQTFQKQVNTQLVNQQPVARKPLNQQPLKHWLLPPRGGLPVVPIGCSLVHSVNCTTLLLKGWPLPGSGENHHIADWALPEFEVIPQPQTINPKTLNPKPLFLIHGRRACPCIKILGNKKSWPNGAHGANGHHGARGPHGAHATKPAPKPCIKNPMYQKSRVLKNGVCTC